MASGDNPDPGLSDEVLMLAAEARARARQAPEEDEIRNLAAEAMAHGGNVSPAEVRQIADQAIEQTHELSRLLHRLAALLPGGEPV